MICERTMVGSIHLPGVSQARRHLDTRLIQFSLWTCDLCPLP